MPAVTWARRVVCVAALLSASAVSAQSQQVEVVRSSGAGVWGSELRVVEEVRVGQLEGAEEYTFGRIGGIAIGQAGELYVADVQVPAIRVYDNRGRFLRNVGREGQGPGEYRSIGGLRTFPDGRLALWDNRNLRVTVYTPAGEYQVSYPVPSGLFAADIFQIDRAGGFYVRAVVDRSTQGRWKEGWIRVSGSGTIRDTLAIPSSPASSESFVLAGPSGFDRPFNAELVTAMSPLGYLITGDNRTYAFELNRGGAGRTRVERDFKAVALSRAEKHEWEAWAEYFERRAANPSPAPPNVIQPPARRVKFQIPDEKPAYSELRTDSEGRIWVRRYVPAVRRPSPSRPKGDTRPARTWREPPTYDVFDTGGRFLGTVTLPWTADFMDARGTQVWVTLRGEFDEAYVARLRVEPGS